MLKRWPGNSKEKEKKDNWLNTKSEKQPQSWDRASYWFDGKIIRRRHSSLSCKPYRNMCVKASQCIGTVICLDGWVHVRLCISMCVCVLRKYGGVWSGKPDAQTLSPPTQKLSQKKIFFFWAGLGSKRRQTVRVVERLSENETRKGERERERERVCVSVCVRIELRESGRRSAQSWEGSDNGRSLHSHSLVSLSYSLESLFALSNSAGLDFCSP